MNAIFTISSFHWSVNAYFINKLTCSEHFLVPNFWVGLIFLQKDSIILLLLDVWPSNYYFSIVDSLHLMLGFCARVFFSCTWVDFIRKNWFVWFLLLRDIWYFQDVYSISFSFIKELNYLYWVFPFYTCSLILLVFWGMKHKEEYMIPLMIVW